MATVDRGRKAVAPPSRVDQQPDPLNVAIGASYTMGIATLDLGAVANPSGGSGARRFGSPLFGANTWLGINGLEPVVGGATYRVQCSLKRGTTAPNRGTILTFDEYSGGVFTRRTSGVPMLNNGITTAWTTFTRTIKTLPTTTDIFLYYIEGWQAGAEIDVYDCRITRVAEIESGEQAFSLRPWGVWAYASAQAFTARWLRYSFTGSAADAFLQLGRIWAGPALITSRNVSLGHAQGAADPGLTLRSGVSGVRTFQRGTPYRIHRYSVAVLPTAEALTIEEAAVAVGSTGQVFAARDHLRLADTGMFGSFSGGAPSITRTNPNKWQADFAVEEDL
jgi:hypothetical protein